MYSIQREMTEIIIYMVNIVLLIVISKVHTTPVDLIEISF